MEDQVVNSSDLLQMPLLVIETILSNVLNLSSVSQTCKILYEIVCDVEKRKRVVMSIMPVDGTDNSERFTIDDDAVFASIMNSLRRITEVQLDLGFYCSSPVKLNERQLERITAIIKRFGSSITSLMLRGVVLSTNEIIGLLNLTPKLEALKFEYGAASGNATMSLHLPNLKKLKIFRYTGLLGVVNLIPAGLLNYYSCYEMEKEPEILKTVLTTQHNIKSLIIRDFSNPIGPIVLCVNHLQLDKLKLELLTYNNDQLIEILKCHMNLKELRLRHGMRISLFSLEWICNNLKKLEVFEVDVDRHEPQGINLFVMLGELKNLRDLSTNVVQMLPVDKVQFQINSLEKLNLQMAGPLSGNFNEKVHSIAGSFANLTDLDIELQDFSQLSIVLSQCTKLIRLSSFIEQPDPQQLAGKRFPNIRQLEISTDGCDFNIIRSIVRAMPNLKSLSTWSTTTMFNVDMVDMVKELICEKNSLEDLYLDYFKLDDNLPTSEDFVNTVRCLSDHLKTYRLRFHSSNGNSLRAIKDILCNEFKVRDDRYNPLYFSLYKGDLTMIN